MSHRPQPFIRRLENVRGWKWWVVGGSVALFVANFTVFMKLSRRVRDQEEEKTMLIQQDVAADIEASTERRNKLLQDRLVQLRAVKAKMEAERFGGNNAQHEDVR